MSDPSYDAPVSLPASLFVGATGCFPALTILTGPSGSGKTTCCAQLAQQEQARGRVVGGLLSPLVMQAGRKTAIELLDLFSGARRLLAVPRRPRQAGLSTLGWQFDREVLAWGNRLLAALPACDLVILDELGPLEFTRGQGFQAGIDLIDSRVHPPLVVVIRPALAALAQNRWPWGCLVQVADLPAHHISQEPAR